MSNTLNARQKALLEIFKEDLGFNYLWRPSASGLLFGSTHYPPHVSTIAEPPILFPEGYRSCNLSSLLNPDQLYTAGMMVPTMDVVDVEELLELPMDKSEPDIFIMNRNAQGKLYVFEITVDESKKEPTEEEQDPVRRNEMANQCCACGAEMGEGDQVCKQCKKDWRIFPE